MTLSVRLLLGCWLVCRAGGVREAYKGKGEVRIQQE